MKPSQIFFFAILLRLCSPLSAQQFNFKNFTVKDGLGSADINHIFQDSRGYIWFATQGGGVSRFNGREFKTFTKADGLPSNEATFIAEDKAGNIWIATSQGASEFNGADFKNYAGAQGLIDGFVYSIYVDSVNKIWFATKGRGVRKLEHGKFDSLTVKNGLTSDTVYAITGDGKGNYWFGLQNGIARYDGNKIISYDNISFVHNKVFFSALCDRQGTVWFGSASGQVVCTGGNGILRDFKLPADVHDDFIGSMAQDKAGNLWFATDHGALKYHDNTFSLFTEKEGLSVNSAQAILCDYEGNIWIGTLGGGANLLRSEAFVCYTQKDGLKSVNISAICADPMMKGRHYVGTAGNGLYVFNPQGNPKFAKVNLPELESINISSVVADGKGLLWLSAQEGVFVAQCQPGGFILKKWYKKIAGVNLISPTALIHDSKGNYWLSTFGSGLFLINEKGEKCFSAKSGSASDNILTVFEDSKGGIWAGAQDAGVLRYNDGTFEKFNPGGRFPARSVWSITEDGAGNIFLGSGEDGLYRYDGKTLLNYLVTDGLCSNYITALQWDKSENCLWLGAQNGINKIQFGANGGMEKTESYGAQEDFYSFGVNQNAVLADAGLVWFGSINGLWRYDPGNDIPKSAPPKIQITGIRLAYRQVNWQQYADSVDTYTGLPVGLNLSWRNNHLTFNLQALTTGDAFYKFKLEGQDDAWSPLTKNGEANYSNISPGKSYVFKAKAVNSAGIESAETISFPFTINPSWWNTWWFRLMALAAIAGAFITFVKTREKVLKAQNIRLEKTVAERTTELVRQKEIITVEKEKSENLLKHTEELNYQLDVKNTRLEELNEEKNNFLNIVAHDLKNPLGTVRTLAEISADSQTSGEKREQYLRNISITTDRMYELVNNLLDANFVESGKLNIHKTAVNLNELIAGLKSRAEPVAKRRNIELITKWPAHEVELTTDKARLEQILENYLSNALKYCPAKSVVQVKLAHFNEYIEIAVEDNGPGIKETEQNRLFRPYGVTSGAALYGENKTGLGLAIVKKIGDALGSETGYRQLNGTGSVFYIRFLKS